MWSALTDNLLLLIVCLVDGWIGVLQCVRNVSSAPVDSNLIGVLKDRAEVSSRDGTKQLVTSRQ